MVLMITSLLVKWYFCMTSWSSECLFMFMMAVVMALSYRLLLKVEWGRTMPMESLVLPSRSTFPSCCCREYLEWREFWPIWMALGKLLKALWLLPPWPSVTASTAPHTSSTWLLILAGLAAGSSRAEDRLLPRPAGLSAPRPSPLRSPWKQAEEGQAPESKSHE